jgi:hypothetical protein
MSLQVNEYNEKNCYECYKIINDDVNYHVEEKDFCSEKCMQKYRKLLEVNWLIVRKYVQVVRRFFSRLKVIDKKVAGIALLDAVQIMNKLNSYFFNGIKGID